jgi:hypothetical protein
MIKRLKELYIYYITKYVQIGYDIMIQYYNKYLFSSFYEYLCFINYEIKETIPVRNYTDNLILKYVSPIRQVNFKFWSSDPVIYYKKKYLKINCGEKQLCYLSDLAFLDLFYGVFRRNDDHYDLIRCFETLNEALNYKNGDLCFIEV